jgi:2-succinyl-5-enolpyruvyl-6-hydroxy-3-cyclohexene-1-carboxylate synthase
VNPSTAFARVLVDELVRGGVTEAVLAPGSRSAPLALALHAADTAGRLRLHVRIDERSAAFLALGLALGSGRPVPVVTTSGTATAHLHAAVMEASHSGVPLLALTADRPPELRGVGANQTTAQVGLYGDAVRMAVDVEAPETRVGQVGYWRALVSRALLTARGLPGGRPGPVHLNLGLREPLVPDGDETWVEPFDGRPGGAPWASAPDAAGGPGETLDGDARTLVVAGHGADPEVGEVAAAAGWPVLAEPSSGLWDAPTSIPRHLLLLGVESWRARHAPERIVVTGRPTLARAVTRLLADRAAEVVVVSPDADYPDATRSVSRVVPRLAAGGHAPAGWLQTWRDADAAVESALGNVLDGGAELLRPSAAALFAALDHDGQLTEPAAARAVAAGVPSGGLLLLGSSQPVRDVATYAVPPPGVRVLANRGVSGIDGTVSTAIGAALAHQRAGGADAVALVGDLTFLHDANGLILGPDEPRPDLTIVVVNNDGGGIFGLLEQAGADHAPAFERVFGTPHGAELAALCAATGTPCHRAETQEELRAAVTDGAGVRVVEVRTDRSSAPDVQERLRAAVAAALGDGRH